MQRGARKVAHVGLEGKSTRLLRC